MIRNETLHQKAGSFKMFSIWPNCPPTLKSTVRQRVVSSSRQHGMLSIFVSVCKMMASHVGSTCLSLIWGDNESPFICSNVKCRNDKEIKAPKERGRRESLLGNKVLTSGDFPNPSCSTGSKGLPLDNGGWSDNGGREVTCLDFTLSVLGPESRTELTPVQTCRCAVRPPQWSPGKILRLQQQINNRRHMSCFQITYWPVCLGFT